MRNKIFAKAFFLLTPLIIGGCSTVNIQKAEAEEYCQKTKTAKTLCIKPENVSCEFLRKPDRVVCTAYGVLESLSGTKSDWSSFDDYGGTRTYGRELGAVTCRQAGVNTEDLEESLTCNVAQEFDLVNNLGILNGPPEWRAHLFHECSWQIFQKKPDEAEFQEITNNKFARYFDKDKKVFYFRRFHPVDISQDAQDNVIFPVANGIWKLYDYGYLEIQGFKVSGSTVRWKERYADSLSELKGASVANFEFNFDTLKTPMRHYVGKDDYGTGDIDVKLREQLTCKPYSGDYVLIRPEDR